MFCSTACDVTTEWARGGFLPSSQTVCWFSYVSDTIERTRGFVLNPGRHSAHPRRLMGVAVALVPDGDLHFFTSKVTLDQSSEVWLGAFVPRRVRCTGPRSAIYTVRSRSVLPRLLRPVRIR